MSEQKSIMRKVLTGKIMNSYALTFLDPNQTEQTVTPRISGEERKEEYDRSKNQVPLGLHPLDKLSREYRGHELLSLSLLFVTNNAR